MTHDFEAESIAIECDRGRHIEDLQQRATALKLNSHCFPSSLPVSSGYSGQEKNIPPQDLRVPVFCCVLPLAERDWFQSYPIGLCPGALDAPYSPCIYPARRPAWRLFGGLLGHACAGAYA